MALISYENTYGVILKIKKDLTKLLTIIDTIVQLIFLIFYSYSIYTNLNNTIMLIIYSSLFLIALIYFIYHLITLNKKSETKKKVKVFVRYFKYIIKFITITIAIFDLIKFGITPTQKIMTMISIISLTIQILLEIIKKLIFYYIDLFIFAIKMDYDNSQAIKTIAKIGKISSNPSQSILEALDSKKNKKSLEETNLTPDQIKKIEEINKYKEDIIIKNNEKQKQKEQSKTELKQRVKSIFQRKNKK